MSMPTDRPETGQGGVTDNCLPIYLDIVKKVRYDVGCQNNRRCQKCK